MGDVVRFAPSPTGHLHVGGARTAIFNWILAKKSGGKFLLRIEDTDKKRSTQESIEQIYTSLKWLGLNWDNEVYLQSRHQERHVQVAEELLTLGKAYRCFCSKELLAEKRKIAEETKGGYLYDGVCRNLEDKEIQQNVKNKLSFSIRFKLPAGEIESNDIIIGQTAVKSSTLDDFIILRSDGTPVYQLAVVVDDHDMGVTKVLRGADHLSNIFKQKLIYNALDWPEPEFGHLPLILGADKVRLSKRHGATSVEEFQSQGILPEVLFNYLCLLGWSPGDDSEILDQKEIINKFDEHRVNKSAAVFDIKKLFWMNSKYIAQLPFEKVMQSINQWLDENNYYLAEDEKIRFKLFVELLKIRSDTIQELKNALSVYFNAPNTYDEKGKQKFFKNGTSVALLSLLNKNIQLQKVEVFEDIEKLEAYIRNFAENQNVGAAKIIHPLRLALTGKMESPGIFELIFIFGRMKVLERLKNALDYINKLNDE